MRAFGGTNPFLIACGPSQNDAAWTRGFFNGMGGGRGPTGYAMHYYQNGSLPPTAFTVDAMNQQLSTYQTVERAIVYQRTLDRQLQPSRRGGPGRSRRRGGRAEAAWDRAWRCSWMNGACGIN